MLVVAADTFDIDAAVESLRSFRVSSYRRFDKELRAPITPEPAWLDAFRRIAPGDVERLVRASQDPVLSAAVISCHWYGYVREEAVRWLGTFADRRSVGMLLVRAADWARPVADLAAQTLRNLWPLLDTEDRLACLPLLAQLSAEGSRLSRFVRGLTFEDSIDQDDLLEALDHTESDVRRFAARRLARTLELYELVDECARQSDPIAALTLGRVALSNFSFGAPDAQSLLNCRVGSIRGAALVKLVQSGSPSSSVALERCLLDSDSIVRSYAQHESTKRGTDLRAYYLASIDRRERNGLVGLSDVATDEDLSVGYQYLKDSRQRNRYLACRILQRASRCDPVDELFAMIEQDSSTNARIALKLLLRSPNHATVVRLWHIGERSTEVGRQTIVCSGLQSRGRWEPLTLALESVATGPNPFGLLVIERTIATWGGSFTSPTKDQSARIQRSLTPESTRLPTPTAKQLRELIGFYVPT
jgi:hypothetical protein